MREREREKIKETEEGREAERVKRNGVFKKEKKKKEIPGRKKKIKKNLEISSLRYNLAKCPL